MARRSDRDQLRPRMGDKSPAPEITNGPSSTAPKVSAPKASKKRAAAALSAGGGSGGSPRSPLVKRKRTPAEYYQSDVIEAISKSPSARTPSSEKELFYNKGSYLAVRNEHGLFYACQTQQNVYKSTKTFKVQWLEMKKSPDLFEMSFYDTVEAGAVLTEIRFEKAKEKNLWRLSKIDIERVEKILELAKKKEKGEWDETQALPPILTMELDTSREDDDSDDSDSDEDSDEEDKPSTSKARRVLKKIVKAKRGRPRLKPSAAVQLKTKSALQKAKNETTGRTSTRGRPPKTSEVNNITKVSTKSKKVSAAKSKKAKLKKIKSLKKEKKKEKVKKVSRKNLHPNSKLTQRPDIEVVTKDPMFEVKADSKIPAVSKFVLCKNTIRAVLTNDTTLLQKLIDDTKEVPSCFVNRSVDVQRDALAYAIRNNNQPAIKLLAKELTETMTRASSGHKRVAMPTSMIHGQRGGRYNFKTLGHAVREISQGRGSREGNNAFTKDSDHLSSIGYGMHCRNYVEGALESGISKTTYEFLCTSIPDIKRYFDDKLHLSVKAGNRKVAAHLIEKCLDGGGHGFNQLHKEVLSCDKPEDLSTFRAPSVKKKPYENDRVTPLHCAAINPNPKILGKLLSVLPEYNLPDRKQNKPIHYAAACQGTGPLELLLSRGINPEETNNMGFTPLMVAASHGRLQNLEVLLKKIEQGENEPHTGVHHKDSNAYFPIHYAAQEGHTDCVKALAKHGADVETITSAGKNKMTALMLASRMGHTQTVKALVELGAVIEKKDKLKRTALIHAVMNGHYPVASYLLRKGTDVNAKDSSGNTPSHYAAAYGWWHCLKLLFQAGADANQPNDWKIPPLGIALMKGHQGCADLILEQPGVDLNFRDDSGSTLVMLSAASTMSRSMVDQMEYLVKKKGAKVNLVDVNGQNALHYLAVSPLNKFYNNEHASMKDTIKCSLEVAHMLIDAGADVMQLNKDGESAVNIALKADLCNSELVAMLIKKGTTVSTGQNSNGQNVLHLMAEQCRDNNQAPLLRVLAETLKPKDEPTPMEVDAKPPSQEKEDKKDADQNGVDKKDAADKNDVDKKEPVKTQTTPLKANNHTKSTPPTSLKELASVPDNNGYTPLLTCIETYAKTAESKPSQNALDMMQALVEVGEADVNVQTKEANGLKSAVHFLANIEEQSMTRQGRRIPRPGLKLLLKHKANINLKDKDGRTPLIAAILAKKTMTAKFLIESGANVNIASDNEKEDGKGSPLVLAARNNLHDVIPALLNKGADEWAKDSRNNMIALHYAAQSKDLVSDVVASVKALLRSGINVNSPDKEGRTALHYAINADSGGSDSSTEIVETLIERRANVFARDIHGRLPLHYAFIKLGKINDTSHIDPIEMLSVVSEAMKGQQMNLQDKFGQTPLHGAALRGAAICCMYIVERVKDFDVRDRNQNTPLALAVMGQHDSVAIMLIQKSANINTNVTRAPPELEKEEEEKQKEKKKYWLWKPVRPSPPSPTVKSLLREIIDHEWQGVTFLAMDRLDRFQMSYANAVQGALEAHKYQLVLSMIRKQKNPQKLQVFNSRRRNLLHVLAINGVPSQGSELQVQVASELFHRGFKLYMKDDRGCTPLHYAAVAQNLPLCKIFAEKDPDGIRNCITSQDLKGRVPMAALVWSYRHDDNTQELIKLFSKYGGSLNIRSPLPKLDASTLQHMKKPESLEELYHSGQDRLVDLTPLILMIYAQNWRALKFLVQNGADPNFCDKFELSPMMHAVKQNELDLVKVLCNHDYEPLKKNRNIERTAKTFGSWAVDIWEKKNKPDIRIRPGMLGIFGSPSSFLVDDDESPEFQEDEVSTSDSESESDSDDDDDVAAKKRAKREEKAKAEREKKFIKTSNISLTAVDSHGKSIIHHAMKTCNHGTYENVALLKLLVEMGAPTDVKDKHGQTPLDYAIRAGSSKMACALQRLMKIPEENWVKPQPNKHVWSDGISWGSAVPDFDSDAKEMVKSLTQGDVKDEEDKDTPIEAKVDPLSQLADGGEIVMDTAQNIPYDVLMTKVDVKYGVYGMNNFYKMQIIHQQGKGMYLLFTRWGRIGEDGQFQRTPLASQEEAVTEFCKIFKAKSGNAWADFKNFHKEPKKYQLVKRNPWIKERRKAIKKFEFNLESKLPSKLPTAVQDVLKHLTSIPMLNAALKKSSVDTALWSIGNIPKDTLLKAKEILLKIRESLEEAEAVQQATFTDVDKHQAIMEKVADMSSEYYELIPYFEFSWDKIEPLTSDDQLSNAVQKLTNLMDLELTNRILMGAQRKGKDVNSLDYLYRCLGCQMQLLDENSTESQLILQHIQNTKQDGRGYHNAQNPQVASIFRISRDGEEDRLASCNLDNHMLLWHGSSATNLISILKRGLLVTPPEAPITGFRFGRGIYSADTFSKSINYCDDYLVQSDTKFMLLCEVALGKMDEQKQTFTTELKPGYDSIKGCGCKYPDPRHNLLLPSGAVLPLGKLNKGSYCDLEESEYIVYKPEQVCLRYLVVCKTGEEL